MRKHPVQKFICLTFLYAAVIVGIFVLQFKTESVFSKSIGNIHVSLAQTQTEANEMHLKNQFQVSFGGLIFSASERSPLIVSNSTENSNTRELVLASWQEAPNAVQLIFTDGTILAFSQTQAEDGTELYAVSAVLQNEEETLSLPFKVAQGVSVQEESPGRLILSEKGSLFAFTAPLFERTSQLVLNSLTPVANYAPYNPTTYFEFSAVQGLALTDAETYSSRIKQFRSALVTRFTQNQRGTEGITEKQVMAYIAEMAANGRYSQALDSVSSFKRNNRRTYLSSPYFGSLIAMDKTLGVEMEKDESMVRTAISQLNLDIFTVSDITSFILREKKKPVVANLMAFPATMDGFLPTVRQAIGIITIYAQVQRVDAHLASPLKPLLEDCATVLAHNAQLQDGRLIIIEENDEPLSQELSIRAGQALFLLGTILSRSDFVDAGRLLVSEHLAQEALADLSLQTMADLYPLLASENKFYPHQEILGYYGTNAVWAWTCAPSVTYQIRSDSSILISTDFIQDAIHHTIFKNIPSFHASGEHTTGIVIQGMNYRSAADFEDWNAFGYVYQAENNTLYLKSRHKTKVEAIELYCDPPTNYSAN